VDFFERKTYAEICSYLGIIYAVLSQTNILILHNSISVAQALPYCNYSVFYELSEPFGRMGVKIPTFLYRVISDLQKKVDDNNLQ